MPWAGNAAVTDLDLLAVSFSGDFGTAVGLGSIILRTTDFGATWQVQLPPNPTSACKMVLTDVHQFSAQQAIAVGSGSAIYRTIDGSIWQQLPLAAANAPMVPFYGIAPRSATEVFLVGHGPLADQRSAMFVSNAAVDAFFQVTTHPTCANRCGLDGVHFADSTTGVAVGYRNVNDQVFGGYILRWSQSQWQDVSPQGNPGDLMAVHFPTPQIGFAVGQISTILKTIDGGLTWSRLQDLTTLGGPWSSRHWINGVHFINANQGWVVGNAGSVARTDDGGLTWRRQQADTSLNLHDVYFKDSLNGVIVGAQGTILVTATGGDAS